MNDQFVNNYYVERFICDRWFVKTNEMSFEECEQYIKESLKESPKSKYRIIKTHTDIVGEYTGNEYTVHSKKIIHCHMCDKVIIKDEDSIHIYHRISEDGEGGYYSNDIICCSKECALSAADNDICRYNPEYDDYEYRNAGWYNEDEDAL